MRFQYLLGHYHMVMGSVQVWHIPLLQKGFTRRHRPNAWLPGPFHLHQNGAEW